MKRRVGVAALALLFGVAGAQLVQPDVGNAPVNPTRSLWNDHRVDVRVAGILRRACADCHSNETAWPWYSKISPVSWALARHVNKGRAKLNFSDWSAASPDQDQMEEIYDSIAKKKMPLASYLLLHPGARLSKTERDLLLAWVDGKLKQSSR